MQLPPPQHGASQMNSHLINSEVIKRNYYLSVINLQFAKSIKELEKFSIFKVFKVFIYGFEIVKRVFGQRPDLVYYTLSPKGFGFYRDAIYVLLLKFFKLKIVFHLHGKGIKENAKKSQLKKYLYTRIFKNTYVICLSEKLADDISDVYKNIPFVVPNGIEVQPKLNVSIKKPIQDVPQILYLSNYIRTKGILVLIDALSILHNQGYHFNARLVGAPADLSIELLENKITNQNLKEIVKVTGPLYGNDKFSEFQKTDIFAFPTNNDAFPVVVLEAMQYNLPVISTFEGGIPEIIVDGKTGYLVEGQNAQILAKKIAILLDDKNLRINMGKKGYKRFLNNFTQNHFENNMNSTFQTILGL